jgi:hypothetical protein
MELEVKKPCPCGCGQALGLAQRRYAKLGVGVLDKLPAVARCVDLTLADPASSQHEKDAGVQTTQSGWRLAEAYMSLAHGTTSVNDYSTGEARWYSKELENWTMTAMKLSQAVNLADPEWVAWYRSAGRPRANLTARSLPAPPTVGEARTPDQVPVEEPMAGLNELLQKLMAETTTPAEAQQVVDLMAALAASVPESERSIPEEYDEDTYRGYLPVIDIFVDENDYDGLRIADALATSQDLAVAYRVMMEKGDAKAMHTLVDLAHDAAVMHPVHPKGADPENVFADQAAKARGVMSTTPSNEDSWLAARNQAEWCEALFHPQLAATAQPDSMAPKPEPMMAPKPVVLAMNNWDAICDSFGKARTSGQEPNPALATALEQTLDVDGSNEVYEFTRRGDFFYLSEEEYAKYRTTEQQAADAKKGQDFWNSLLQNMEGVYQRTRWFFQ